MTEINTAETAKSYLEKMLSLMEIPAKVIEEKVDDTTIMFKIECDDNDAKVLIGRKGQTLESLQFLLRQMVKGAAEDVNHYVLDVRDYRVRREEGLLDRAKRGAVAVLNGEFEEYELPPMSPFERRMVHNYLHEHFPELASESRGLATARHIVLSYKGITQGGDEAAPHHDHDGDDEVEFGEESSHHDGES